LKDEVHAVSKKKPMKKQRGVPQNGKIHVVKSGSQPEAAKLPSKKFFSCPKAKYRAPMMRVQPWMDDEAPQASPKKMVVERPPTKPLWSIWD
jgi:hypothetical protein